MGRFIGSEIAAALASNGNKVVKIFPERAIGDGLFPADLALSLNDHVRERSAEVLAGETVVNVKTRVSSPVSGRRVRILGTGHLLREAVFYDPRAGWTT